VLACLTRSLHILAVTAIALGLGWVAGASPVQAESDELSGVDGATYESPTWGFTLEWDEDDWEVVQATSEDGVDAVLLSIPGGALIVRGLPLEDDAEQCRRDYARALRNDDGVDDWEPLEDEEGDPIAGEEPGRAFAAFSLTFTTDDGEGQARVNYVECRSLVPHEAMMTVLLIALRADYEDVMDAALPVLDSIALAGNGDSDAEDDGDGDEERPGAASSCEAWFVETKERSTRALELNPPPGLSATIPEALEFAEGYRALAEEQAESAPPPEAAELNELMMAYFEAWGDYWRLTAESLQDPGNTSLLLESTEALTLALGYHADLLIDAQLVAAECGLDERVYTLP
jgi:hypothetical protein